MAAARRDSGRSFQWRDVVRDPRNQSFLEPYLRYRYEARTLFESIGEDLGSPRKDIRARAYTALVILMPELTGILHEQSTRNRDWRNGVGDEQKLVNRGMDVVTRIYIQLVEEGRFNPTKTKDPRSYIRMAITNAQVSEKRHFGRLQHAMSIDDVVNLRDSDDEFEKAHRDVEYEVCKEEISSYGFLDPDEAKLFEAIYVDDISYEEYARSINIGPATLRKRVQRARSRATSIRDEFIGAMLWKKLEIDPGTDVTALFSESGTISEECLHTDRWSEVSMTHTYHGHGHEVINPQAATIMVPITRSFGGGYGNIYILGVTEKYSPDHSLDISHRYTIYRNMNSRQTQDTPGQNNTKISEHILEQHRYLVLETSGENDVSCILPKPERGSDHSGVISSYQVAIHMRSEIGIPKVDRLVRNIAEVGRRPILVAKFEAGRFPLTR